MAKQALCCHLTKHSYKNENTFLAFHLTQLTWKVVILAVHVKCFIRRAFSVIPIRIHTVVSYQNVLYLENCQ